MARRRTRKERRPRRFSRRNPLAEQYADEPYDDSTWEVWGGPAKSKGAWLGHPSKKALLEFARVQDAKTKQDVSPLTSIGGWVDTFPPPEGMKSGLEAARDNLRRLKIVLKQQGIDLDELQRSDPERAKAIREATLYERYFDPSKGEIVDRISPRPLRFPAGPEVIDRLIEIGNQQNFWMLPSEGPLTVFEAYNTFGYPEKPTRKKLQKLQKKKRKAIRERRIEDGPAKLHRWAYKRPVEGEKQGWTLLQTEEEYKDIGDRFGNCVWWNHWYNNPESDRIYYKKDPESGVETIARYHFDPFAEEEDRPYLEELAVHFGGPTTWVLSPSPRAATGEELEWMAAPHSGPAQQKRTKAMRREIRDFLLRHYGKAKLTELMFKDGQGIATRQEEQQLDMLFLDVSLIIARHGGLTNIRVQYPATVEGSSAQRSDLAPGVELGEIIERAAGVLVAGEPGHDKILTPVERIYEEEEKGAYAFAAAMNKKFKPRRPGGDPTWPNPRRKKVAPRRRKTTRRRRARKNPLMSDAKKYVDVLAYLRAIQWYAWTGHWRASGDTFYGDHLLLNRLYAGRGGGPKINDQIDDLGERIVAYFGPQKVDPGFINKLTGQIIETHRYGDKFKALYSLEEGCQHAIRLAWEANQKSGAYMSLGLDDYLMSLANERDTAIYLLGRRLGGRKPLSGPSARKNPRRKLPRRDSKGRFVKSRRSSTRKNRK